MQPLILRFEFQDKNGATVINNITANLNALGEATKGTSKSVGLFELAIQKFGSGLSAVKSAVFSFKSAIAALGIGLGAKAFIDTADMVEKLRIRMLILTGSQEQANDLFQKSASYAKEVTAEYKDIMDAAVNLKYVVRGSNEEVVKMVQVTNDIATASGLSLTEATSQMTKALSAGIGAADMFQQRGVKAMLGFKEKVDYTAKETKEQILKVWEEGIGPMVLKDAAKRAANTFGGILSMIKDGITDLQTTVADAGVFQLLKDGLQEVNVATNDWLKTNKALITSKTKEYVSDVRDAVKFCVDHFRELYKIVESLVVLQVAVWFGQAAKAAMELDLAIKAARASTVALSTAAKANIFALALWAAVEAGIALRDNAKIVYATWVNTCAGFQEGWVRATTFVKNAAESLGMVFRLVFAGFRKTVVEVTTFLSSAFDVAINNVGVRFRRLQNLAANLGKAMHIDLGANVETGQLKEYGATIKSDISKALSEANIPSGKEILNETAANIRRNSEQMKADIESIWDTADLLGRNSSDYTVELGSKWKNPSKNKSGNGAQNSNQPPASTGGTPAPSEFETKMNQIYSAQRANDLKVAGLEATKSELENTQRINEANNAGAESLKEQQAYINNKWDTTSKILETEKQINEAKLAAVALDAKALATDKIELEAQMKKAKTIEEGDKQKEAMASLLEKQASFAEKENKLQVERISLTQTEKNLQSEINQIAKQRAYELAQAELENQRKIADVVKSRLDAETSATQRAALAGSSAIGGLFQNSPLEKTGSALSSMGQSFLNNTAQMTEYENKLKSIQQDILTEQKAIDAQRIAGKQATMERLNQLEMDYNNLSYSRTQQQAGMQSAMYANIFASMGGMLTDYINSTGSKSKALVATQKTLMAAQAIMAAYASAAMIRAQVYATPGMGMKAIPAGELAANMALAAGFANAGMIMATAIMHTGGEVKQRAAGRSDEVDAVLQTGEYVVSRKGVALLDKINQGIGGIASSSGGGSGDVEINNILDPSVIDHWAETRSGKRAIMNVIREKDSE